MIRSIRTALAIAAVTATAVTVSVPAVAASAPPKGALTATEYAQLTAEQTAFKKLKHDKRLTWKAIYGMCSKVGRSTALLSSVRTGCDTGIGIEQALVGFFADVERCSALSTTTGTTTTGTTTTGTTTTGTTTTGTATTTTSSALSPEELKLFACLEPEYVVIGRAANSVDRAQLALRSQVLARHFTGRCLLTLAPTKQELRALGHFVTTAKQLAKDVERITKVADGQAPASSIDGAQVEGDSPAFNDASRAYSHLHRPQNLSVCPRA